MQAVNMRVKAWYGDEIARLPVPDRWRVCVSRPAPARALTDEEIADALRVPVGTATVGELARPAKNAVVVVEDMTRPTPVARVLPALLSELASAGLGRDSVRFVMALGCHRQMPRQEMVRKLGKGSVGEYEVLNHDLDGRFQYCGRTERGTPIYINEAVMSADLRILIGTTYPRGGTGFGGGAKCLVPGVAAQATIEAYHRLPGGGHLEAENDMRHDIEDIARRAGVDCIVNAVLNGDRDIAGLFVGDVVGAHRAAADYCKQVSLFPLVPDVDVVISNAYPFDTNLRYTWRGTWPFAFHAEALKVLVDYCPEGTGYHQLFKARGRPFAVRASTEPSWHLFSPEIGPKEAYEVHPECLFHRRWEDVVRAVESAAGPEPSVAVYPDAGIGWHA
jgi:nickel-dependent lactate racemase